MDAQAGMLARPFEHSMGLGPEWRVEDVWFDSPEGADEELHIRVGGTPGAAVARPERGARCGACDTRERTWRHLDIWQSRTVAHCRVPRADCPEHGPRTVRTPWELRPDPHFTALFEAQVVVMAMSGVAVTEIARRVREPDSRIWDMLGRAVDEAREGAGYSGVTRVGVDDTARARGRRYISVMADVDGRRVVSVTEGGDKGAPARLCDQPGAHGGDRSAVAEVTRDMASSYSLGCAEAMPNAAQTVDRFHVMRLLSRALDKTRCAEAKSCEEKGRLLRGTKHVWPKRPENLTERQAEKRASLASEHLLTARARAMVEAVRAVYSCATREEAAAELDRAISWIMHSNVPEMKKAARSIRDEREGVLDWFSARSSNGFLEGMNSIIQSLKRASRGFRNVCFTTMIFLRLGRLDFSAQMASGCATH